MKNSPLIRWPARLLSFPAGFLVGAYVGDYVCYLVLRSEGKGNSHSDMIQMAFASLASGIAAAAILGIVVWNLTALPAKKPYWEEAAVPSPRPAPTAGGDPL